jgi:hypothetical protein
MKQNCLTFVFSFLKLNVDPLEIYVRMFKNRQNSHMNIYIFEKLRIRQSNILLSKWATVNNRHQVIPYVYMYTFKYGVNLFIKNIKFSEH